MLRQRAHVLRGLRPTPHFRSHSYDVDVGLGFINAATGEPTKACSFPGWHA